MKLIKTTNTGQSLSGWQIGLYTDSGCTNPVPGSLTIYTYDLTNAEKDGVWDSSYVSTGVFDQTGVNDVLGGGSSTLGNGGVSYGYAIKGVELKMV